MKKSLSKSDKLIEGKNVLFSHELTLLLLDVSWSMDDYIPNIDIVEDEEGNLKLDVSSSDNYKHEQGYEYTKFTSMKEAMKNFVKDRALQVAEGSLDQLGVISFSDEIKLIWEPSKSNFDSLIKKIDKLQLEGSTQMHEGIMFAQSVFSRYSDGFFRMVVVSDGMPNERTASIDAAKRVYEELGVITDTIGIGNDCDDPFMNSLAQAGGGEYVRIESHKAMLGTFKKIESERRMLLGDGVRLLEAANGDSKSK